MRESKNCAKIRLAMVAVAAAALLLTGCGEKDVTVSVTLVNRSGREISSAARFGFYPGQQHQRKQAGI